VGWCRSPSSAPAPCSTHSITPGSSQTGWSRSAGGTKGGLWTQIVSDVTGITQELSNERIGASYGDALFAGRAAGLVSDHDDWEEVADTVKPNPANREAYDRLHEVYQQLYRATKEQVHMLAALQLEEGVTPEG
jgi:xylulokinase